jgi:hypothetical protein
MPSHCPSSGAWAKVQAQGTLHLHTSNQSPVSRHRVASESPPRNVGHRFLLAIDATTMLSPTRGAVNASQQPEPPEEPAMPVQRGSEHSRQ